MTRFLPRHRLWQEARLLHVEAMPGERPTVGDLVQEGEQRNNPDDKDKKKDSSETEEKKKKESAERTEQAKDGDPLAEAMGKKNKAVERAEKDTQQVRKEAEASAKQAAEMNQKMLKEYQARQSASANVDDIMNAGTDALTGLQAPTPSKTEVAPPGQIAGTPVSTGAERTASEQAARTKAEAEAKQVAATQTVAEGNAKQNNA